jgi:hypothetical protein
MAAASRYRIAVLGSLAALAFAALHLGFEHFTGGVRGHHLLADPDLPLISNWFGLAVLPVLGGLFGARVGRLKASGSPTRPGVPKGLWFAFGGALAYGALLAVGFEWGASDLTSGLFFALFLVAVALPVYRAEYVLGFVMGMTFTFGGVLPALIGSVFVILSLAVRLLARATVSAVRVIRRPRCKPDIAAG